MSLHPNSKYNSEDKQGFWALLAAILFIVALWLCSGCVTQEACNGKFPPQYTVRTVYETKTVKERYDSLINIKGDSFYLKDTIWCDEFNRVRFAGKQLTKGKTRINTFVDNGVLNQHFSTADTNLLIAKYKTIISQKNDSLTYIKQVYNDTAGHWKWSTWYLIGAGSMVFIWLLWKTSKFWMKMFI